MAQCRPEHQLLVTLSKPLGIFPQLRFVDNEDIVTNEHELWNLHATHTNLMEERNINQAGRSNSLCQNHSILARIKEFPLVRRGSSFTRLFFLSVLSRASHCHRHLLRFQLTG